MKKLLLVLLVVALAAFLLVGCNPVPLPDDDDVVPGTGVTVVIKDAFVDIDGKTYVSEGAHDITVTFPAAVAGVVTANITACGGDYSKATATADAPVVLFPDATKKIWTGSGTFAASSTECCASYVEVISGECDEVVCIAFPVIIDGCPPYAAIKVTTAVCSCLNCGVTFASTSSTVCDVTDVCCGDDCSGLASWAINIYDGYPFNTCCDPTVCEEPIDSDSGVCPINFTTLCLKESLLPYYAVVTLVDKVGLKTTYYAKILVDGGANATDTCTVVVVEGFKAAAPICVTWTETGDLIGTCTPTCPGGV